MDEDKMQAALETTPPITEGIESQSPATDIINQDDGELSPTELETQRENSRLGRKVARLETTIGELSEQLRTFLSQQTTQNSEPADTNSEFVGTREDVKRIIAEERKQENGEREAYQSEYKRTLSTLGVNDLMRDEIIAEMFANNGDNPFNRIQLGIGKADARLNYSDARAAVIAKKYAGPKPNVRSEGGLPTGLGVTTQSAAPEVKEPIKLDPVAEKFARQMGMTDDQIRNALKE